MQNVIKAIKESSFWLLNVVIFATIIITTLAHSKDLFFPLNISKSLVFSTMVLITIVAFYTYVRFNIDVFIIRRSDVLFVVIILFIVINKNFIQENHVQSIKYFELIGTSFMYLFFRNCRSYQVKLFLIAIILTAAIQGIYGILQYLDIFQSNNSYFKISGSFLNPGPFGGYLASALPISLGLFFDKIRKRGSESVKICIGRSSKKASSIYIYGVILTIQVIALVLSESRSAWIAVIISIVVFCFIVSKSRKKEKIFYLYTGAFMLFTLLFGARHLYEFKKDSADGRLFIWTVTSDIILDNPVFGVGFDGFKSHYMNAQKNRIRANSNSYVSNNIVDDVIYTFNEPLQFICENGIVGGALLFLFILYSFPNRHIFNKQTTIIAFCGCLSICIFSLFSYVSDSLPIILNLILYVSILGSNSREVYSFCCIRGNLLNNLYMLILFLVISIGLFKIFHFYQSVKAWNKANQIYMLGDYNYSLIYYEKAYVSFVKNGDFMAMYGKSLLSSNKFEQAINILKKAEELKNSSVVQCALGDSFKALHNYNMAENAYLNASSMVPGRLYPYYLLLKLYEEKNDEISALHMAEFILTKRVKVDSQAIDQMLQEAKRIKSKFRT